MLGLGLSPITRAVTGVGVGRPAWMSALPELRSFITANYNQPNPHNQAVMASPPTITVSASLPAGMAVSNSIAPASQDTAALRILGGRMFNAGGNSRIYSATIAATGGNGGTNDGKQCSAWRADIDVNAAKVSFRVGPTTAGYRFLVNGQYVSLAPSNTVGTTGTTSEYMLLDFSAAGGKALRRITIEGQLTCALVQVWCEAGGTLARPTDSPKRIAIAGDSFTHGTGATQMGDAFGWVAADALGFPHNLMSGSGGTGYVATSGGVAYKLFDRIADINSRAPHDVIVLAMGVNDIGQSSLPADVTTQVTACLTSLRNNNPTAAIFVVGPWDQNAPSAPVANYAPIKAAIQAGIPAGAGITFLDPEGVAYTKFDTLHPDTAGHKTLGEWLALQIKTALGA